MDNPVKKQIVEAIKSQMAQKKLSQNQWARENSDVISVAHMSNVMNERNWSKVSDSVWNALRGKLLSQDWDIYITNNYQKIQRACDDAQSNHKTIAISAYTGAGKTTALTSYMKSRPNVWYLVLRSSYSRKDLIYRIAEAMGIQSGGRTIEVEDAIIQKMTTTSNALLILDSVSKLTKDASLQFIGDLAEAIEHRAGLVIAGTEFLKEYIDRCCRFNKRGFRELKRRVFAWVQCSDFHSNQNKKEVVAICQACGIESDIQISQIMRDSTCFGTLKSAIERMKIHNQRNPK